MLAAAKSLDVVRISLLRFALQSTTLRSIFTSRAQRVFFLFAICVAIYLPLSLFFPLWILAIGPVIWGIPHLFASYRYVPKALDLSFDSKWNDNYKAAFRFVALMWLGVSFYRIAQLLNWPILQSPLFAKYDYLPEASSLLITALAFAWIFRAERRQALFACAFLMPLIAASWLAPLWTVGALLILHNWVAFFYWYKASKNQRERQLTLSALALFALLHVLVILGVFDFAYPWLATQEAMAWAGIDYTEIGRSIAPWSGDAQLWFHLVVLYAFGQSIHYFVWLKAIPDYLLPSENPRSFVRSYKALQDHLGGRMSYLIIIFCLTSLAVWCVLSYPHARALYFALASYHGYMEISGLGLLLGLNLVKKPILNL